MKTEFPRGNVVAKYNVPDKSRQCQLMEQRACLERISRWTFWPLRRDGPKTISDEWSFQVTETGKSGCVRFSRSREWAINLQAIAGVLCRTSLI